MIKKILFTLLIASGLLISQSSFEIQYSPENYVTFHIDQYGNLEYELANSGNISYDFEGKTNSFGKVNVSYDFRGRPSRIDDINISYNFQGKVSSIGSKNISYDYSGRISQIGSIKFTYDFEGKLIKAGYLSVSYDFQGRVNNVSGSIGSGIYLKFGY